MPISQHDESVRVLLSGYQPHHKSKQQEQMAGGGSSRPGKGSRVPKNVKIRPAPPVEERAKARRKGTGRNAKDGDTSDEDEDEEDRRAREQFAQDSGDEEGDRDGDQDMGKEDEQRPLEGMIVCSSGHLRAPRDDIKSMCEALGAVFEQVLTTETTFLIADATESDKYKACVENGIPVIQSSFILELHHRWLQLIPCDVVGLSNFLRLPPLQDLTICLTGYTDDRNGHRYMITKSGGAAYSPDLNNEVTHLVVGPVFTTRDELIENGKYKYAKQINAKRAKRQEAKRPIYIVWGEWLEHCLYAFGRVKEEFYSTDVFPDRHEVKPAPGQRSQDIIERRNIASPKKVRRQRSQGDQAQIKSKRKLIKQESVASMNGSERTSRKRSGTSEGVESLAVLKKGKTEPEGNDIDMEGRDSKASFLQEKESKEDLEPAAVRKQSSALSLHPLDGPTNAPAATSRAPMKKQRSSTHMELLGVQDLLVPKANSSSYSLQSAATSTTATLAPQPESSIMANPTPSGTNNSLLSRMGKERSNKFFSKGRESTPVQTKPDASTSKTTLEACKAESVEVLSRSASPLPVPQMPDEEVQVAADHGHNVPAPSRLFEGKRFHVVEDDFDKSLRSRITDLMIERGAIPSATINDKTDLVICKTISDRPAPFNLEDTRMVTADWIEACMAFDEIVDETYLVEAFKRPVRCRLPLPGLTEQRVCVSYSGFDADYEKPKIISWLDALGIAHEPYIRRTDMEDKLRTTHIIIPDQSYRSQRLGTAQEWGIQVVYPQWIREMALQHPVSSRQDIEEAACSATEPDNFQSLAVSQTAGPSSDDFADETKPLNGCRVHIPRRVEDWRGLERLALALGARTIQNFDSEMAKNATHLIFQTSQTKPASRDFSLATQNKVKIVHPDWIRHTAQKGNRQPEASYKHTRNSKRSLEVLIESQGMSRVSSSSSSKSAQEAPASDDNDLPPPLKIPSAASTPAMAHSTPRSIRSPEPPKLKTTSSSSSAPFASTPDRLQALSAADDQNYSFYPPEQHKLDDSGFVASAGKGKVNIETSMSLQTPSEMHRGPKPIDETLVSKKSLLAEMEALLQKDEPTPQQLSARLPFKQQGLLQSRTSLRKTVGRFGGTASPNSSLRASAASIGTSEGASLSRRQPSKQFEETQFGHDRNDDTQTQSMLEEQTMVIRINDPVAEATKAKTLAEMRRARTGEDSPEDAADAEATQRSTDETKRSSSRRSRSGHYATRQRS